MPTWFVELAVIPLLLLQYDRKQYYYLCAVMFTGMTLCLGLYLIFPNGLDLRVEITRQNIFADLVPLIQAVDTPTNVCPSIHVASGRCNGSGPLPQRAGAEAMGADAGQQRLCAHLFVHCLSQAAFSY